MVKIILYSFDSGCLQLKGVCETMTDSQHGIYSVKLPLNDKRNAHFSGICLDAITREFPIYPKLSSFVGGNIDYV